MFTDIKKQASSFVQEKYKSAKLALTDVTQAELLTEEALNSDPWGPDAKTMTRISEAAYDMDDYWRIVGIIHMRLQYVNYKEWRQSYKALVLLEFLLTHGPEDMFEEFHCDINVIQELGKMNYLDERGFNWGACMKQKSERILAYLSSEAVLTEARAKALRISKEIQGFGNLIVSSPTSSSASPSSASSRSSRASSSFGGSYMSWGDSPRSQYQEEEPNNNKHQYQLVHFPDLQQQHGSSLSPSSTLRREMEGLHLWDNPIEEKGPLIDDDTIDERSSEGVDYKDNISPSSKAGWSKRFISSRFFGSSSSNNQTTSSTNSQTPQTEVAVIRSISNVGKLTKKKIDRQLSLWL